MLTERQLYERAREALQAREDDIVDVTIFGGPTEFLNCGPTRDDYIALARRAYIRGDLTIEEFEAELDRLNQDAT